MTEKFQLNNAMQGSFTIYIYITMVHYLPIGEEIHKHGSYILKPFAI